MKKFITIMLLILAFPAYAGIYENALKDNKIIFLYIYTPDCSACKKFTPIYNDLSKQHNEMNFIKVNADTLYGVNLLRKFKGSYIPYVVLTDSKTKKTSVVAPYCTYDRMCLERAIKNFKN